MTLRTRLTLTVVAVTVLLVAPALYGVSRLARVSELASRLREQHGAAYQALGGLQTRLTELDRQLRAYVAIPDSAVREETLLQVDSLRARLVDLAAARYVDAALSAGERLQRIARAVQSVDSLLLLDEREQATTTLNEARRTVFADMQTALGAIGTEIDRRSARDQDDAREIAQTATTTTVTALGLCVALALLLGAWTTRALVGPTRRLERAMAAVANGDFRVPDDLPYRARDEIGSVSRSFRSMTNRLADLDRMKAEFMSIATHELKTPINVISGYAELMQERVYGDLNERQHEALAAVREQVRLLTTLVNQLLDISRLEAGGLRMQFHDVVVADLFDRVGRAFGPLAEKKRITFTVDVDPATPATFPGDADRLRDQVLGNLLSNALKFTPEAGRIAVRARGADGSIVIEVADTGPGIPADKLPRIFDKFFQVGDHARSKGAGLGLAIAHEVIDAHGGRITAESQPGHGTTFRITLPAAPRPPAARAAGPVAAGTTA
jgi:signal transduction histidine kinase